MNRSIVMLLLTALLGGCGDAALTSRDESYEMPLDPERSRLQLVVDGRRCEPRCRTFYLGAFANGEAYYSGPKFLSEQTSASGKRRVLLGGHEVRKRPIDPQRFHAMLGLLDELDLLELKNAQYFQGPPIDRSHCTAGRVLLSVEDPRHLRSVGLDMGCPEHVDAGKRLVAALADLAGVTATLGEWPRDDQTTEEMFSN